MFTLFLQVITVFIVARLLWFLRDVVIRALARRSIRWTSVFANRFALITTEQSMVAITPEKVVGGNVVDVLHSITGRTLVRKGDDPMDWYLDKDLGPDPDHDNYLFRKLGAQDMGSIFFKKMTIMDKRSRYALDEEGPGMTTKLKKHEGTDVHFTGEVQVAINEADTADGIGIDIKVNFIFERKFPYRSVMRVAEETTFLATMVEEIVNSETSDKPVRAYYGGEDTKENRKKLGEAIEKRIHAQTEDGEEFRKSIEDELGLVITEAVIHDVDLNPANKALLAKRVTAAMEAEATTIKVNAAAENTKTTANAEAEATRVQRKAINDADADRVQRVTKPAAESDRTVAARFAEALENNEHLTHITYAPGTDKMLPVGNTPA